MRKRLNNGCHCEECVSTTKQSTAGFPQWIAALPLVARNDVHGKVFKSKSDFTAARGFSDSQEPISPLGEMSATPTERGQGLKKVAFTLAEVLITLVIIGVIAAITIPNLMQSWQKHERIVQIKEAYSIIQNATKMATTEHGAPADWAGFGSAAAYAKEYFIPYVKIQKLCGYGATNNGCFDNGKWKNLNGTDWHQGGGHGYDSYYQFILQNGMEVAIYANTSHNGNYFYLVDVNGKQGPTTLGKDVFVFMLNRDTANSYSNIYQKVTAAYRRTNTLEKNCSLDGSGYACAYFIEHNGWEFPDNYPVKKF